MKTPQFLHRGKEWRSAVLAIALICLLAPLFVVTAQSPEPQPPESAQAAVGEAVLAVARVITYQGRLLTPSTGVAKPDGNYEMGFRVYRHPTSTAQADMLWMETQTVPVRSGLFSVALGSVSPFAATVFTGQDLWLGVTVGTDTEMTPRTRLTAVAYALYADNADRLDGIDSAAFALDTEVRPIMLASDGAGSGLDADLLDGTDSAAFALKTDVMPVVLAGDGAGSGVDADRLDGIDSAAFALKTDVMPVVLAGDGAGSGVDADRLDGLDSTNFARNLGYAVAYAGQCLNVNQVSGYYHYQVETADDVRIWKIRPHAEGTQFEIINFSFRRHVPGTNRWAYHFQVRNSGTNGGAGGLDGCFDIVFYRLQ